MIERTNPQLGGDAASLFAEIYAPLASWCTAWLGDESSGRDVASEAFVRLLSRWTQVRQPRPFLYTCAANMIRDRWRRERLTSRLVEAPRSAPDTSGDVEVRDLVRRLPERLRIPTILHYWADLSVEEIGHAVHRPTGTVKRQLGEARDALRKQIEEMR